MFEGKLETIYLHQSSDLIWIVDSKLLLTYANLAYLNLMKQVTGKDKILKESIFEEGFGEGYIEKWRGYYRKALSGEHFELEEHYSHPETNEIKYGQVIFNPIRDENNQVVAVACLSRDITRIVKQRSEANQLLDASLDVFCTLNEAGNFVFVSEAATKHWGYSPNELIGKPYLSFIIAEDIPKTNAIANAILNGQEIKSFVNRYNRKDGSIAYNLWSARWDNEAKLVYGVARDAKEKIEQENLLQQSEQRFKALVQEGADMISIIDLEGRYSYTSPTTTGILGITPEEFQGRTIFDFIHPDDIERATGYMQRINSESKVIVEPFRLRDGNNKWRWIETVLTNMLDNPAVNGIVANSRDITAKKETEQLLDSASKLTRIGSWEIVMQDSEELKVFWSSMTKNLLEIDESFEPTIADVINFCKEPSRTLISDAVNKAIEKGEAIDLELDLKSSKGNDIWVRCIGEAQFENGKVTRVYGSFQDINARKVAELNQLKLIEEKINILESFGDAFYALDGELNFTYMNSSCANLLAVKKEKIIGKNLFTEFPDLKNTKFEDELRKVQHTTEATKFEFYYPPFDAWFDESIFPTPTGISVYFVDITQRIKANEEIAKSEEKRRLIMNGALDAIITIDINEAITFWNPQAEVIFGWKTEEVIGKSLSEMIIPESFRKFHVEGLKNYLKTGEGKALNVLLELSAIKKDKVEFPIELTVLPIKQGSEEFFCAFIRDITERKKAENKLIENENYLRAILDNEPECVKILNSKGELLSMNPAGLTMIEADNEQQVLGHRMTDLVKKEYQIGFNRLSKEVFKGNSGSFEFEIIGLKGGLRWLQTHAVPLKDITGKVVNLLGVTRDITEQKKAEEKLLNAFNEKTRILERITEAFVSLDTNWCYTYMNKQAGLIFKRDPEKIIGKHIWTEFPEGLNQPFHLAYEKAMATQKYIYLEEHYKPYDLWFENHIYPSPDGISIFFRDVTKRKKAEREIKEANERFEKVTEATKDVIWDWDIESGTFFRSNAIDNFFGVRTSKVVKKKDFWIDNFHKEDLPKIKSSVQKALTDPNCDRWEEEYRILNNNNDAIFVIDRGLILRNKDGKAIRMVGAMTNITEQKKQEKKLIALNQSLNEQAAELRRSNEELEQFAYVASHDLQEPLRMISSFMDQLQRKYKSDLDDKALQYIHFATDGSKRMKQIIQDLLDFSKSNRPTDDKKEIDLNTIFSDYKQSRRKLIQETKATILSDSLPTLKTYQTQVTQIFHCLLDNAIKYVPKDKTPSIILQLKNNDSEWLFSVKDNGIGINPQFHDKIFIIFQRLHNRDEYSGTGVGLSIVKRSVEFLGGKIWLESTLGEGTTFYFTIPK